MLACFQCSNAQSIVKNTLVKIRSPHSLGFAGAPSVGNPGWNKTSLYASASND